MPVFVDLHDWGPDAPLAIAGAVSNLPPSGHLFLAVPKLTVATGGVRRLLIGCEPVDLVTWTRPGGACGYLAIAQKPPIRAKGVWTDHGIPDVWHSTEPGDGPPPDLMQRLYAAVDGY